MSEPFIIAARIPMSFESFAAYLTSEVAQPDAFDDWDSMYNGWYWEGTEVLPHRPAANPGTTLEHYAARLTKVVEGRPDVCLVVHDDDCLWVYDAVLMGPDHNHAQHTLAAVRAAANHVEQPGHAIYWAETSGRLPDSDGVLAALMIEPGGARFTKPDEFDANAVLAGLAPIEQRFLDYLSDSLGEGSYPNPAIAVEPRFIDPAIAAELD